MRRSRKEFNLTPVFLEDKIDGSDVAAVPWDEVARALREASKRLHVDRWGDVDALIAEAYSWRDGPGVSLMHRLADRLATYRSSGAC